MKMFKVGAGLVGQTKKQLFYNKLNLLSKRIKGLLNMRIINNRREIQNGDIVTTNHPDFKEAIVIFDGYRSKSIANVQNAKKETRYFYLTEFTSIKRPIK